MPGVDAGNRRAAPIPMARRRRAWLASIGALLAAMLLPVVGAAATVPMPASSARAATAAEPHTVTYDHYSLKLDGKRVYIWSGSFQYWRLPSPSLWLDVLQKMKAAGFNTVTLYFNWEYHSPRSGVYDFSGVRDVGRLLDMAQQVGLYVIARPGPYIEAESNAGGLPGWVTQIKGLSRSTASDYTAAYMQWLTRIDAILARHQYTNGTGPVILYQVENELYDASPMERDYMRAIERKARADGITVPLTGNHDGTFASGVGAVDIPGYDSYPQGFDCWHPDRWNPPHDFTLQRIERRDTPLYFPEFQGGSFDPWGGPGYAACRKLTGPDFERVFEEVNIADGSTMQNFYMTFGGTTWGWLAYPGVYTSYDYGAAIDENRQLTAKYYQQKLLGYFVDAVQPLAETRRIATRQPSNPALRLDGRVNPDGMHLYVLRHADATAGGVAETHVWVNLGRACAAGVAAGSDAAGCTIEVPQQPGTNIRIDGRDSKMLLTDYRFGHQTLVYSTSELMTDAAWPDRDVAVLYGHAGDDGETVLAYRTQPTVRVLSGAVSQHWDAATHRLRLDYRADGLARVEVDGDGHRLLMLIGADAAVKYLWALPTAAGRVFVVGPYLTRTAVIQRQAGRTGEVLQLTGDTERSTLLEVIAPSTVTSVTWNGQAVATTLHASGGLVGTLPGPQPVALPKLATWKFKVGAPEIEPGFDDSRWQAADHATSNNPDWDHKAPVLFADDYGFHVGDIWYRGHFVAHGTEQGLVLVAGTGAHGVYTAWLNGHYLGRSARRRAYFNFDPAWLRSGAANVISVLVENMGHDENDDSNRAFQRPRGLVLARLAGAPATIHWKLQGNRGGEDPVDAVRGPFNNGGLYGERHGWSLLGYPDAKWNSVTLPHATTTPGVDWYRTRFTLHLPADQDVPIALRIEDAPTRHYRALIFINGWQMGRYINALGPQHEFVLPPGILNTDGDNTIAISSWSTEHDGGLGKVSLIELGNYLTPLRVAPVDSPGYDARKYAPRP